jgi:lysophospholipase L1-like esterase
MTGMSLEDPRIAEGHRICLDAILRMQEIASNQGIDFRVLLIPTKELVFKDLVATPSPAYRALVANEEEMWSRSTRFFEAHGIRAFDALPTLRSELVARRQPYPMSDSGHPKRDGQAAIARLVAEQLAVD